MEELGEAALAKWLGAKHHMNSRHSKLTFETVLGERWALADVHWQ